MNAVTVDPVRSRRDLQDFLLLPREIYRDHPLWVHPLLAEQRKLLDPRRNPAFTENEIGLFLARWNGRPVGRLSLLRKRRPLDAAEREEGKFGFFESIPDPAVSRALFDRARRWMGRRDLLRLLGPFSPTIHDECGILVDGFDSASSLLTTYHPPHYDELLRSCGLAKAMDFLGYTMSSRTPIPPRILQIADRTRRRESVTYRGLDLRRFNAEVELLRSLYNEAWAENWGFEPLTEAGFRFVAQGLRQIVDPDLVLIGFVDGEPAGFTLALPDLNQALRAIRGRLFPLGLFTLLREAKRIDRLRVAALGVRPKFQRRGLDSLFYLETYRRGTEKGYTGGEFSWVLEHNDAMNRGLLALGAKPTKRWRIYALDSVGVRSFSVGLSPS